MSLSAPLATSARPLTVRSFVLSLLLGTHPLPLTAAQLVKAGEALGFPAAGVRVALSRGLAAGDLNRSDVGYVLGERLLARQRAQSEAIEQHATPWNGAWETAIVVSGGRPNAERVELRTSLTRHRLAELREGVWLRPANLIRPRDYESEPTLTCCESHHADPAALASTLWDLDSWATRAIQIIDAFEGTLGESSTRFVAAAEIVRHLTTDPLLPAQLLPDDWPGAQLRREYGIYQDELRDLAASFS